MQDIVDKFDRAKELLELAGPAGAHLTDSQQDGVAKELLGLGIDAIGELIANSRRIAVALETIAGNTKPVKIEVATLAVHESKAETLAQVQLAFDAAGMAYRPGMIDKGMTILEGWNAAGISFQDVVLPTIRTKAAEPSEPVRSLAYFDAAVRHAHVQAQ